MYSSLKTYKLLRSFLFFNERLPCPTTIRKHVQKFVCRFGLNDEMFYLLEAKLQTVEMIDRNASLVFDEMDLQATTNYCGHLKELLPKAKKALAVIVRGLKNPFKEVVFYDFDRGMDLKLLEEIIKRVEKAGAAVRTITLDMGNKTLLSQCQVNMIMRLPQRFLCSNSCLLLGF